MDRLLTIVPTRISNLMIVERSSVDDQRGVFLRLFCADELATAGWTSPVSQINHSLTKWQGTIRGMHYQKSPYAEMKLVTCIGGRVLDVAADLRTGSASFLEWFAVELSPENRRSLMIPKGFAHGFQALTDDVEMIYCHSAPYRAETEGGLHPLDVRVGIKWPLPVSSLSSRDVTQPFLTEAFRGLVI